MLSKNLALIVLVVFAAGCGTEVRSYVMTKDRVGLDQGARVQQDVAGHRHQGRHRLAASTRAGHRYGHL